MRYHIKLMLSVYLAAMLGVLTVFGVVIAIDKLDVPERVQEWTQECQNGEFKPRFGDGDTCLVRIQEDELFIFQSGSISYRILEPTKFYAHFEQADNFSLGIAHPGLYEITGYDSPEWAIIALADVENCGSNDSIQLTHDWSIECRLL